MTRPLRVGIIGGGWIARVHVPAIDAAPGLELVAACDTAIERAEAIAAPRGGTAYARWEEMLERERLDALWVCTPPLLHRGPVEAALAARHPRVPREADRAHARGRRRDRRRGRRLERDLRRRLPVARERAARRRARAARRDSRSGCWSAATSARSPGARGSWTARRAAARSSSAPATTSICSRRSRARSRRCRRRPAASASRSPRAERHRGRDLAGLPLRERRARLGAHRLDARRPARAVRGRHRRDRRDARAPARAQAFRLTGRAGGGDVALEHGEPMDRSIARFVDAVRAATSASSPASRPRRDTLAVALACERALASGERVDGGAMTPPRLSASTTSASSSPTSTRTSRSSRRSGSSCAARADGESHVRHYRSGDATIELIEVHDEGARTERLTTASRRASSTSRSRSRASRTCARRSRPAASRFVAALRVGERADDLDDRRHERRRAVPVLRATPRSRRVRIGFVGAGAIARRHARSLRAAAASRSRSSATSTRARAASLAARARRAERSRAGRRCSPPSELDAVFVCTPPALHADPADRRASSAASPSTSRSRSRARSPTAAGSSTRGSGASAVCAVGYQWRSLDLLAPLRAALGGAVPGLLVSRSFGPTERGRDDRAVADAGPRGSWFVDPAPQRRHPVRARAATTSTCSARSPDRSRAVQAAAASGRLALAGAARGRARRRGRADAALRVGRARQRRGRLDGRAGCRRSTRSTCWRPRSRSSCARTRLPARGTRARRDRVARAATPIRASRRSTASSRRSRRGDRARVAVLARRRVRDARDGVACEQAIATGEAVARGALLAELARDQRQRPVASVSTRQNVPVRSLGVDVVDLASRSRTASGRRRCSWSRCCRS